MVSRVEHCVLFVDVERAPLCKCLCLKRADGQSVVVDCAVHSLGGVELAHALIEPKV